MKCLCLGQFLSNYCSYSQWYIVHAYMLAWPLEHSHPCLTLTFISQYSPLDMLRRLTCWYNHFEFWFECLPWSVLDRFSKCYDAQVSVTGPSWPSCLLLLSLHFFNFLTYKPDYILFLLLLPIKFFLMYIITKYSSFSPDAFFFIWCFNKYG